jgi:hypothetical protein
MVSWSLTTSLSPSRSGSARAYIPSGFTARPRSLHDPTRRTHAYSGVYRLGTAMAGVRPQSSDVSVVVIGGFNPRIFEPLWFSQQGLVPEVEAQHANAQLVDGQFARLDLPWAIITVIAERLDVTSNEETVQTAQIRDLSLGILRLLPHTPAQRIGINHLGHFAVESEDVWHKLGHELTPKGLWEEVLERPGMLSVTIKGQRMDGYAGSVNVTVQPSVVVHPGIFINVNDDFGIEPGLPEPAGRLADILEETWVEGEARSSRVMDAVMRRASS